MNHQGKKRPAWFQLGTACAPGSRFCPKVWCRWSSGRTPEKSYPGDERGMVKVDNHGIWSLTSQGLLCKSKWSSWSSKNRVVIQGLDVAYLENHERFESSENGLYWCRVNLHKAVGNWGYLFPIFFTASQRPRWSFRNEQTSFCTLFLRNHLSVLPRSYSKTLHLSDHESCRPETSMKQDKGHIVAQPWKYWDICEISTGKCASNPTGDPCRVQGGLPSCEASKELRNNSLGENEH